MIRERAARSDRPWALGDIDEGEEWFACAFREQSPFVLNAEQWDAVALVGAGLGRRIRANDPGWTTSLACAWCRRVRLDPGGDRSGTLSVRDRRRVRGRPPLSRAGATWLSCLGRGRGGALIDRARSIDTSARFIEADATREFPQGAFDVALCLYDVLGSSPDPLDDTRILDNIRRTLHVGGFLVISVMNELPILGQLDPSQQPATRDAFVKALDGLRPSHRMQDSGDIHEASLLLHYEGIYYRKEQFFRAGDRLPPRLSSATGVIRRLVSTSSFKVTGSRFLTADRSKPGLGTASPHSTEAMSGQRRSWRCVDVCEAWSPGWRSRYP